MLLVKSILGIAKSKEGFINSKNKSFLLFSILSFVFYISMAKESIVTEPFELDSALAQLSREYYQRGLFPNNTDSTIALLSTYYISQGRIFTKSIDSSFVQFNGYTNFCNSEFKDKANFSGAKFKGPVIFNNATFNNCANFGMGSFSDLHTKFDHTGKLAKVNYHGTIAIANMRHMITIFSGYADFGKSNFEGDASFAFASFKKEADFSGAIFKHNADFESCVFDQNAVFAQVTFNNSANFEYTTFKREADFSGAIFNSVDFLNANFNKKSIANFSQALIKDSIIVGNFYSFQWFDLRGASFSSDAKIVIIKPVALRIQMEKFKFLKFADSLDYYSKKDIIEALKDSSFTSENDSKKYSKERFELDYIFEKSTMYQSKVSGLVDKWYHVWKWPRWAINFIYYITMGLGYKPFKLIIWIIIFIQAFAFYFTFKMPHKIKEYLWEDSKHKRKYHDILKTSAAFIDKYLSCLYFSAMIFLSFKLNKNILTFFSPKEKRTIVGEWFLGFLTYAAFLVFSEQGSILNTLKNLFFG